MITMDLNTAARTYATIPLLSPTAGMPQLRPTGWTVTGSKATGAGGGGVFKIGAGVTGFTIQNGSAGPVYEIEGFYTEVGIGAGVDLESRVSKGIPSSVAGAIIGMNWKLANSVSTDFGGTMPTKPSDLYFGHKATQPLLTPEDFKGSDWLYINIGGNLVAMGGDTGLLMLMQKQKMPASFDEFFWTMNTNAFTVFDRCLAWCWFAGMGSSFGISAQGGVRSITMTSFKSG